MELNDWMESGREQTISHIAADVAAVAVNGKASYHG